MIKDRFIRNCLITILIVIMFMNLIGLAEVWHQNQILSQRLDIEIEESAANNIDIENLTNDINTLSKKVDD